jgi:two-component system, cell cycle response regulator
MAGKILVIDSVMPNRIILKVKLSGAGYDVAIAASGREGVAMALQMQPDLVIVDMDLPDTSPEGVMAQMRLVDSLHNVLVIMVSANTDLETRLRAYRAGCDEFYQKPFAENTLLARIRSFFREDEQLRLLTAQSRGQFAPDMVVGTGFAEDIQRYERKASVIILGDAEAALMWKHRLPLDERTHLATFGHEVVSSGGNLPFGVADVVVILSDSADPNAALHLVSTLRGRAQTRDSRFCLVFDAKSRAADRDLAYDFGADAIFLDSDHMQEVAMRLASMIKRKLRADSLRERIRHGLVMAMQDPLTNIPNRRYSLAALRNFFTKARLKGGSVAVIICDIDRFKSVNDRFGHATGDAVLQQVARRLQDELRAGDLIARMGGEEFLIALPDADMADARSVAERLVAAVRSKPFTFDSAQPLLMTISAGLAVASPDEATPLDDLINAVVNEADQAMLQAKSQGRNKITYGRSAA